MARAVRLLCSLAVALIGTACSGERCVQSGTDPNLPSTAIECAAGQVCYQGDCIRACSAGQEGAESCASDDDCDGTRPSCIDGFCSACEAGEVCVPTLNVCGAIGSAVGAPPVTPGSSNPPPALDGGSIDGGLTFGGDAGVVEPPPAQVVTRAGLIDVAQIDDLSGGALPVTRSKVGVHVLDVSLVREPDLVWRVDPWDDVGPASPPAIERIIRRELGEDCVLVRLETATVAIAPVDLGEVVIEDALGYEGSIALPVVVPFVGTDYAPPIDLPERLLELSVFSPEQGGHFLAISGAGSPLTLDASWPMPSTELEHIPFALLPAEDTVRLLATGAPFDADLTVRWSQIGAVVPEEQVVLRFRGRDHEVRCEKGEGGAGQGVIVASADLLQQFRDLEGLAPGAILPLYFERRYSRGVQVPAELPEINRVALRIRHTLIGRMGP